jgi:UDP-glucose:glycoprotein glucosyltransferase
VNANDNNDNLKGQASAENDEPTQGFMINKLKQLNPHLSAQIEELRKHLVESTLELAPLKAWQMQDLSLQAAQRIIETDPNDALSVLEDLSQNYPLRARSLSKIQVKSELKKTLKSQRQLLESKLSLEAGAGMLYLDGLEVNIDTTDIFSLNSLLKKEAKLLENLHKIGLSLEQIRDLIYLDTSSKNNDYGIDIRDSSIQWLNDLETDSKYSYWGKNVQEILRPTYPGMMRSIAKNFFHLVFIIDPAKEATKSLLRTAESFYVNDIPLRIGFVFVTNDDEQTDGFKVASVALFRAFNYIKQKTSTPKALSFLTDVYAKSSKNSDVSADFVLKEFKKLYPKEKNLDDVFGVDSDYDEGRKLSMDYYHKIGLKSMPIVFINGFPLSESEIEADAFEESVITKVMQITPEIQMSVYKGAIHDGTNLLDWLMNKDVIMPRLNPRVLTQDRAYLDMNGLDKNAQNLIESLKYIQNGNEAMHPLTIWIVCDPDTEKGRQFLYDTINFYESSKTTARLAVLLQSSQSDDLIKKAVFYALANFDMNKATAFIKKLIRERSFNELKQKKKTISQLDIKEVSDVEDLDNKINAFDVGSIVKQHEEFLKGFTTFKESDAMGLFANGWVLGPFEKDETFTDNDFSLLENFIQKIGLKQIRELMAKWTSSKPMKNMDDTIVRVSCIIGKYSSTEKRIKVPEFTTGIVNVKPKRSDLPYYDAIAVLDPLTRQAQKISTILKVLSEITNLNLIIYFNCKEKLSAPPLKSFYRYVLESEVKYLNGNMNKPFAYFHNMPQSPILTMNMHSPESWMVEAVRSPYDLDNICLKDIDNDGANGEFELEYLVLEGHAFDVLSGQSPRGLQFNLGTASNPVMYDTIGMRL